MEEHATWFIDVQRLTRDLSLVAGPDESMWDWNGMRGMLDRIFSNPSPETQRYLTLIRRPASDAEATRDLLEHFRDDLPRWFQVVMAPALSPAGSIARYASLLPPMLEACGWAHSDAVALLVGDPLASLAREIGLPVVASQLALARMLGWLSADRVEALKSRLNAIVAEPSKAVQAVVVATAAHWTRDEAETAARNVLNDARVILEQAATGRRPLRAVYDA